MKIARHGAAAECRVGKRDHLSPAFSGTTESQLTKKSQPLSKPDRHRREGAVEEPVLSGAEGSRSDWKTMQHQGVLTKSSEIPLHYNS